MPMRHAQYYCLMLESYCERHQYDKYGKTLIPLPPPHFVTLYNGEKDCPDDIILRLSDSFPEGTVADMEVTVRMININYGHNAELMKKCRPLSEYAWLVEAVRWRAKVMGIKNAVDAVINDLPVDFILGPFLRMHKLEVGTMLLTEYDEVKHHELIYASGVRDGREEGREEGRKEGLLSSLIGIMQKLKLSFEQAASVLSIPAEEYPKYREAIAKM